MRFSINFLPFLSKTDSILSRHINHYCDHPPLPVILKNRQAGSTPGVAVFIQGFSAATFQPQPFSRSFSVAAFQSQRFKRLFFLLGDQHTCDNSRNSHHRHNDTDDQAGFAVRLRFGIGIIRRTAVVRRLCGVRRAAVLIRE